METCIIHNGKISYEMRVDDERILFTGGATADYFERHYKEIGYEVIRSGDGSENYKDT